MADSVSVYDMLRDLFASYGLPTDNSDIINVIRDAAIDGLSPELTQLKLQDTQTWKQRFAGNEARRAAGLNVLTVPEYLQQEKQYADVLHNAGLPVGFYDDPNDFAKLIGNSVSVAELQDRVNIASDIIHREDPAILDQLAARGINKDLLLAHALDPERAAPLIKKQQNSILIGAAAQRGLNRALEVSQSDRLAELGIGEAQAIQGFGQINDFLRGTEKAGQIYGEDYDESDAIGEVFEGQGNYKRKRLLGSEAANFGGTSGYGVTRRETGGAY